MQNESEGLLSTAHLLVVDCIETGVENATAAVNLLEGSVPDHEAVEGMDFTTAQRIFSFGCQALQGMTIPIEKSGNKPSPMEETLRALNRCSERLRGHCDQLQQDPAANPMMILLTETIANLSGRAGTEKLPPAHLLMVNYVQAGFAAAEQSSNVGIPKERALDLDENVGRLIIACEILQKMVIPTKKAAEGAQSPLEAILDMLKPSLKTQISTGGPPTTREALIISLNLYLGETITALSRRLESSEAKP